MRRLALALALVVLGSGCQRSAASVQADASPAASAAPTAQPVASPSQSGAPGSPAVDQGEVARAEREIDETNYKAELDKLQREIEAHR